MQHPLPELSGTQSTAPHPPGKPSVGCKGRRGRPRPTAASDRVGEARGVVAPAPRPERPFLSAAARYPAGDTGAALPSPHPSSAHSVYFHPLTFSSRGASDIMDVQRLVLDRPLSSGLLVNSHKTRCKWRWSEVLIARSLLPLTLTH